MKKEISYREKRYKEKIDYARDRISDLEDWLYAEDIKERKTFFASEKSFQEVVECLADIFSMILSDLNLIVNDDYSNIEKLKEKKILSEENKGILCYIVGTGILENKLRGVASELDLKNKIIFVGKKKPDEIPIWMNACDVLVLPSLNEGLPNVVSEALACGKPVVATNVAGTPEILNNDVGYLVKPKDVAGLAKKISKALNKKFNKERLLKRANDFSVTDSVKKLAKIYEECLKQTD